MKRKWFSKIVTIFTICALAANPVLATAGAVEELSVSENEAGMSFSRYGGYDEGAYAEWSVLSDGVGYKAYVSKDDSSWAVLDDQLIRKYKDHMRVDAVGLTEGTWYLKVEAISGESVADTIKTSAINVTALDRSGFAFYKDSADTQANGNTASGAYNEDGSLKSNATVVYITNENQNSVKAKLGSNTYTGISNIFANLKSATTPVDIRIVGCVRGDGSITIKGTSVDSRVKCGITVEGIGEDAVLWGRELGISYASNVEVRNLAFMYSGSAGVNDNDCVATEASDHVFIHHNDMFNAKVGTESDQFKGDGSIDCTRSNCVTYAYNHLWDTGKTSLAGSGNSDICSYGRHITYHHNWFDHCDERHPRIRFYTVHSYNNYFDGVSKYAIGMTNNGNAFVENNYFRNTHYPMMTAMQGSDVYRDGTVYIAENDTFGSNDGGIIKAYGNRYAGEYTLIPYNASKYMKLGKLVDYDLLDASGNKADAKVQYDCYVAASRTEAVSDTVKAARYETNIGKTAGDKNGVKGSGAAIVNKYSNFDTASDMYSYPVDNAVDVPAIVMNKAGRVGGGDFWYNFNDIEADTDSSLSSDLYAEIKNYKTSIVSIGGISPVNCNNSSTDKVYTREARSATGNTNGYVYDDNGNGIYVGLNEAKNKGECSVYSFVAQDFIENVLAISAPVQTDATYSETKATGIFSLSDFILPANYMSNLQLVRSSGSLKINAPAAGVLTVRAGTDKNSDTVICDISLYDASGNAVSEATGTKTIAQRQPSVVKYVLPAAGTYSLGYTKNSSYSTKLRIYSAQLVVGDNTVKYINGVEPGSGEKQDMTEKVPGSSSSATSSDSAADDTSSSEAEASEGSSSGKSSGSTSAAATGDEENEQTVPPTIRTMEYTDEINENCKAAVTYNESLTYNGKKQKLTETIVTYTDTEGNQEELSYGRDYTISYRNNKDANMQLSAKGEFENIYEDTESLRNPYMLIKFKGQYKQLGRQMVFFNIYPRPIEKAAIYLKGYTVYAKNNKTFKYLNRIYVSVNNKQKKLNLKRDIDINEIICLESEEQIESVGKHFDAAALYEAPAGKYAVYLKAKGNYFGSYMTTEEDGNIFELVRR